MPKKNIPLNERGAWSLAELASLDGTSEDLLRAEIRKGKLKARKIGRRTIVTSEDRLGPNPIRDRKTAEKIANILADHGWLVKAEGGAEINGEHRREAWRIRRA